jgi:hypothetical protein
MLIAPCKAVLEVIEGRPVRRFALERADAGVIDGLDTFEVDVVAREVDDQSMVLLVDEQAAIGLGQQGVPEGR